MLLLLLLPTSSQAANKRENEPFAYYRVDILANKRILPDTSPQTLGEAGSQLTLAGCRDEYESTSFAVYARQDMKNLQLEIGDLRSGRHVIPRSSFDPYVVKCWYQAGRDVMFHDGVKRLVPELLLKDDDLVRVDSESETNSVRSTAEGGSTKYLSASVKDPKAL
ncbi:MAG: hypothetical protein OXQ92_10680 [Boseongicola sp.]|nr:hypothetical protein [Boseongicola sp.]